MSHIGIDMIAAERLRQIEVENFTPRHDDQHTRGELAWAAVCFAAPAQVFALVNSCLDGRYVFADPWPRQWSEEWDKRPRNLAGELLPAIDQEPAERIHNLVKAGALIAAEIDRLWRAAAAGADDGASTRRDPLPENRTED